MITLCERYLKFGKPFEKVCGNVQKARDWLRATVESLTLIQNAVIRQALDSLPGNDDCQWIIGDRRSTTGNEENYHSPYQHEEDHPDRRKRKEPELRDVHYHIFGITGAGDVHYNRQLIKVLQDTSRDMSRDMYELANRTDEAMGMITTVTTHLAEMEDYIKNITG